MKTQILLIFGVISPFVFSQQKTQTRAIINEHVVSPHNIYPKESSFTAVQFEKTECITDVQRLQLNYEMEKNRKEILKKNPNAFKNQKMLTSFLQPLRPKAGFSDYGYHTLQNQVDHNTVWGSLQDYNCGTRTYDWAGGNHQGTDYILWPYPWKRMQENTMEVLAAAAGTILVKKDGYADMNCSNNGNPNWNGFVLQHSDGSTTTYMHFKSGTLNTKAVGSTVLAGEYLGVAGSSGSSNIPHLHFEVRNSSNAVIDPYVGTCNPTTTQTWWQNQEAYYVPKINRISTHYTLTMDSACPAIENSYERTNFNAGDTWVLRLFYRDIQHGDLTSITIKAPDGTTWSSWSWNQDWNTFYATAWAHWIYDITSSWPTGTYTVEVNFKGGTYTTQFAVGTSLSTEEVEQSKLLIYPNPASEKIYIKTKASIKSIEVFDTSGKLVQKNSRYTDEGLDITQLVAGNYILKIETAKSVIQSKFIKK